MEEKPEWVPEWIWEVRSKIRAERSDVNDEWAAKRNTVLDEVIADPGCAVLWKAMSRRRGTEFVAFNGRLKDFSPPLHKNKDFLSSELHWVEIFLCRLPLMALGLLEEDKIPAATRRAQGKTIARLASELSAALFESQFKDGTWPHPLSYGAMHSAFHTTAGHGYDRLSGWLKQATYDPEDAMNQLLDALRATAVAGEAWASWESVVSRPNDPNASRLRFIREVSEFFRRMYDSPLRDCVAALTRCLFKCEMDAATVAKLAP